MDVAGKGLGPDEGAARFGHFLAVDGEETVGEDGGRHAESRAVQHRRPEQGVEIGDVLADEVVQLGVRAGRPEVFEGEILAPVAQRLEARHVADRGVQPDIEILARRIGNLEAEIGRVARDVPVRQAGLEPFIELVAHRRLQRAAIDPVPQHGLEVSELEKIVLRLALHRDRAGEGGNRVLEIAGCIGRPADLAGISVLIGGATAWTFALDEAVGQEHILHRVVGLADGASGNVASIAQSGVNQLGEMPVLCRVGSVVVIEADAEAGKVGGVLIPHLVDLILGRDAALARFQHDRCAVSIVGADIQAFMAAHALETHPDVGLDVLHQMAQMDGAVGIGQGAGDEDAAWGVHGGKCVGKGPSSMP